MGSKLGDQLRDVRVSKELSLKAVASEAGMSTAYLQKLEGGEVQNPSPNKLHALAGVLGVPYPMLMELAGYVYPSNGEAPTGSVFDFALNSSDLNEKERSAVADFIKTLKSLRPET